MIIHIARNIVDWIRLNFMKNFISTIVVIAVLAAGLVLYLRNADVDVNYERFNLVAPGVLRTPAERFFNIGALCFN